MQRSLHVTTKLPITIQLFSENEYIVFLNGTKIATMRELEDGTFDAVITHFPKRLSLTTSHDSLHTGGKTLEACGAEVVTKLLNILLNRYLFAAKKKDT